MAKKPYKPAPLFTAACKFGRAGFGAESGSIGVKVAESCMPDNKRHLFIGTTLEAVLSLDPEPSRQRPLDGMEDAYEQVRLQVNARRISVSDSEVAFALNFAKDQLSGEMAKVLAGKSGSIQILQQIEGESSHDADPPDEDDEEE